MFFWLKKIWNNFLQWLYYDESDEYDEWDNLNNPYPDDY